MATLGSDALARMVNACEIRFAQLVCGGTGEDEAADRTFRALQVATGEADEVADPRDRLFATRLRNMADRS
ncbi:MAG: hypothetical protein MRZ21_01075 [Coriobacteriaceae bacterium]|nr:hypothetical protein [Coriobacteriaceae bacterium]